MLLSGKFLNILEKLPDGSSKVAFDYHNYNLLDVFFGVAGADGII
jgi:hypothetical protein